MESGEESRGLAAQHKAGHLLSLPWLSSRGLHKCPNPSLAQNSTEVLLLGLVGSIWVPALPYGTGSEAGGQWVRSLMRRALMPRGEGSHTEHQPCPHGFFRGPEGQPALLHLTSGETEAQRG